MFWIRRSIGKHRAYGGIRLEATRNWKTTNVQNETTLTVVIYMAHEQGQEEIAYVLILIKSKLYMYLLGMM